MKIRFASFLGVLIGIAIFLSPAYAIKHKTKGYHTRHHFLLPLSEWWKCPSISSRIKITAREKEELIKLLTNVKKKVLALRKKIRENRPGLRDMLFSEKASENELMKKFDEIQKLKMELMKTRFQYVLGVRKILGVKRFKMLIEMMRKHWKRRGTIQKHYQKHRRYKEGHEEEWGEKEGSEMLRKHYQKHQRQR